jgi:hypothetical protein
MSDACGLAPETVKQLLDLLTREVVNGEMDRGLASAVGSAIKREHEACTELRAEVATLRARVVEVEAALKRSKSLRDQYRAALEAERNHSNPARAALTGGAA